MKGKTILESWKEISVYLKRSVRTCRRWERGFGLPVHRFGDAAQGHVFAETDELDAWLKGKLRLAEAGTGPPSLIRSIAVLPIENLSGDGENDYFAEGLTEVLITEMGQVGEIRVISHQSVKQFKDSKKPIREIAGLLNVEALVEGALLQTKGKVRLSMNMIGATPERHIWAKLFECDPSEAAALPRLISHAAMHQAGVALTPRLEARLSDRKAPNAEAYEAYLRGRASVRKSFLFADIQKALAYFDQAIALDPGFAPAHAERAWAFSQLGTFCHLPPKEAFPVQREAARRAVELDPALADGYAALGHASTVYDWDWRRADELFVRALDLNPNSQRVLFYYSQHLIWMNRAEEAIAMHHRLVALDPLNTESRWNEGWAFFWARRYDEASKVFISLLEQTPEDHWLEMALGLTCLHQGLSDEAARLCERAGVGVPMGIDRQFDCFVACVFAATGREARAREILGHLKRTEAERVIDHTQIALIHCALGEKEEALERFEQAYREKSPLMAYVNIAPFWKPLGGDPRFRDILRRMAFPNPPLALQ